MAEWFLKYLGIHAENGATLTHPSLAFRGTTPTVVVVMIFLTLVGVVAELYRREQADAGRWRRWLMTALRIMFFLLLCVILLRPVLSFTLENSVRRSLLIVVDTSKSMAIKDPRTDPADLKRAAIGIGSLDPTSGLAQPLAGQEASNISRADLLKAVVRNKRLGLLEKLSSEYDLKFVAFGDSIDGHGISTTAPTSQPADGSAAGWIDRLVPWGPVTPIGDELRKAINRTRGQPLAGLVLLTDGGNNAGSDPILAARLARDENVPIYAYGVGISAPKDIVVAEVLTPNDIVFARDEVPVSVRVRARNLAGQSARLVLTLDGEKVDEKTVDLSQEEQLVPMHVTPQKKGMFDLVASIEPRPDEADRGNNVHQRRVQVIDDKIKVLLVDGTPRWEFKYLMQQLLRDRRVDLKVFLVDADPGMTGPDSPYLPEFPKAKSDLNDKFDVILFGDVDPAVLTPAQIENVNEFVARQGGGFIMVAGRSFSPNAYANTPIEKLLPVELDPGRTFVPSGPNADLFDKPIHVDLTGAGAQNGMLRLSDKEDETIRKWKDLPPIYWDARVARTKPAAQALLVDADPAKAVRGEKMPVIALQQYQLGQVLFVGTDNTWRWRRNKGDEFYVTLWGQMIQRTALNHLLGSKRTRIEKEKDQYSVGEQVTIYAHVYDTSYSPVTDETLRAFYVGVGGSASEHEVTMRRVVEQPGMYKSQFTATTPGNYQFYVDKPGDPTKKENFSIVEPTAEFGDTAMNEPLLQQMAQISGGAFFREEDLYKLPDAIKLKTEKVGWPVEVELWSTKLFFLVALALVCAEWVLRKTAQLK